MEALNTGSAFRDPSRPARKKAGGKKGENARVTQSIACHASRHATCLPRIPLLPPARKKKKINRIFIGPGLLHKSHPD